MIWYVIAKTTIPSWVAPLPHDFGSARHGKLTADQWRSAAMVFMPIALMFIWARNTTVGENEDRLFALITNTMHLLEAIQHATSNKVSQLEADNYLRSLQLYIGGLRKMFPNMRLRPTLHCALHLQQFFPRYGPVIGWWTFPFERMIRVMQNVNHSHRIGMRK